MMRWKVLSCDTLLTRAPFVQVTQERVQLRAGQIVEDYYQVALMDFALVIPFLTDGRVRMIRQYKHGPRREVLGFPAGHLEAGEDPATAARRELLEETGLVPTELIPLGSLVDHGNQRVCVGRYYAATACRRVADPDPRDLEDFAYETLRVEEVKQAIQAGGVGVAHHVAAWGLWMMQDPR